MKKYHSWQTNRPLASKDVDYSADWIILIGMILAIILKIFGVF